MNAPLTIQIDSEGVTRFIYDDRLADLLTPGASTVERASHVEPHPAGGWFADMAPSDGPILDASGGEWDSIYLPEMIGHEIDPAFVPFPTRAEALAAEVAWLRKHRAL